MALWLPAGPLLAATASCLDTPIGCHGDVPAAVTTAERPKCHGAHVEVAPPAVSRSDKAPERRCCCTPEPTLRRQPCGCQHERGAAAVSIDRTLPVRPMIATRLDAPGLADSGRSKMPVTEVPAALDPPPRSLAV
jgi:hypothetical protein